MGKKKSTAKSGQIMPKPSITIDAKVSRDELIAIAISTEETRLTGELNASRKLVKELEAEKKKAGDSILKIANKMIETKTSKHLETVNKSLKALGFTHSAHVQYMGQAIDAENLRYRVTCGNVQHTESFKMPASIRRLNDKIEALAEKMDKALDQGLEAQDQLSQIGTLERQARAAFAKSVLSQTKEGRAMLDSIKGVRSIPRLR